ncbi:hypothetical protein G647_09059 [Cladophialophora carrionii CBS 160.54]|uniref:Uncharacterized protein n=1 Tax=Cladophialophora carrionii CBS 160.54 TaxID=1279043 RepID=V9CZG1_9EURO|nr:uncharacterized protein G647_09059 [Cladophialophora carrionii CBS 160.54]ETI20044.1 hypothetical protein G647_09059 [Cladophialophora carrionii CBS 160.54]
MADVSSPNVKAEPAPMNSAGKTATGPESATSQKTGFVNATTPQSSSTEVASPEAHDNNHNKISAPTSKPIRTPPKLDAIMEDHVRDMMNKARRVANGGDNPFKSEQDIKELTLLANNLVKLMNAAYIATDTIVRGVAYMQGGSQAHPKTAMKFARQDRRARLAAEKAAEPAVGGPPSQAAAEAGAKDTTQAVTNGHGAESVGDNGSNKENAAPSAEVHHQNPKSPQNKTSKKKGYWRSRRALRKRTDSTISKTPENKIKGQAECVDDAKGSVNGKGTVMERNPKTSSSDTTVQETVLGQGVDIPVTV